MLVWTLPVDLNEIIYGENEIALNILNTSDQSLLDTYCAASRLIAYPSAQAVVKISTLLVGAVLMFNDTVT